MIDLFTFFWTLVGDNIVWGTGGDNIVWGTGNAHRLESTVVILD